ncbi:MAG: 5-dehydro-4-deoxy-D-glucuronate isomerase [Cephaloticoccus sp.]|nr:5-dehydro-4-deoxy-D-glucuronate isomerase [Cephaloticoccus sp.]
MELIPAIDFRGYSRMSPEALRRAALVQALFVPGKLVLKQWETDRTVLGGVVPLRTKLRLPNPRELAAAYFNERRELGVINLGGQGSVQADGQSHPLDHLDCLYVGRGAREVTFVSANPNQPARFYLLSYPAQKAYPTAAVSLAQVKGVTMGSDAQANARTIYKFIHPQGIPSCQLVMGVTCLESGSVWNTMPPHTHLRRSEVYLYFHLQPDQVVFHFMGQPAETRHLIMRDGEATLSPPWSIHAGVGTANYNFVWGMGGENQAFDDMDTVPMSTLL